jgi:hypothetical protein
MSRRSWSWAPFIVGACAGLAVGAASRFALPRRNVSQLGEDAYGDSADSTPTEVADADTPQTSRRPPAGDYSA